jgi:glycosyltransferase involved in cell wall biosynthesis
VKVIQVVASINPEVGGPAVSVPRLASALAALEVESTLASLDYTRHGPAPRVPGVSHVSFPAGRLARAARGWSPQFAARLCALAKDGADVVHGHGLWMLPNLYARRAAAAADRALVISPRGMLDEWALRRSRARKYLAWNLFERRNLSSARLFHATSSDEERSVRALGFQQPVALIPNGVDLPASTAHPGREVLERRFPKLAGKSWLLYMSRLHAKKGLPELIRVWKGVASGLADWHLVVAGPDLDGSGRDIEALSLKLGLHERLTFTGMLQGDEKASALAHSEAMVLPTHSENFGLVVAESLAHGTPVITTRAAPWAELESHRCGWWIETGEEALRQAIARALALPSAERREMGLRGRELVATRYGWQRVAGEMKSVYLWICGQGPRPDCVRTP